MSQPELNEAEWRDPANWHGGWLGIYRSEKDTRIIVPKRHRLMGWTVNTGQRVGRLLMYGLLLLVLALLATEWIL